MLEALVVLKYTKYIYICSSLSNYSQVTATNALFSQLCPFQLYSFLAFFLFSAYIYMSFSFPMVFPFSFFSFLFTVYSCLSYLYSQTNQRLVETHSFTFIYLFFFSLYLFIFFFLFYVHWFFFAYILLFFTHSSGCSCTLFPNYWDLTLSWLIYHKKIIISLCKATISRLCSLKYFFLFAKILWVYYTHKKI